MPEPSPKLTSSVDPAAPSAVAALEDDPFYRSICAPHAHDATRRRALLERYFTFSIQEGTDSGRSIHLPNPAQGVAVWLLPQSPDTRSRNARNKHAFLEATLDSAGCANYYRILNYMSARSADIVGSDAWYLSIVAVDPTLQGRGLGRQLLAPTLAEADRLGATCYLETFSPRNLSFYQRLGFSAQPRFTEPTTTADYALMLRPPSRRLR